MSHELGPVELEILRTQLESVAEEMGETLVRGAFSPNITERRDCSTALFDARGRLIAQAEHIPVHLGAMPEAVEAVLNCDPDVGDVFVLNDPFQGGTHLPDVTLVSTISHDGEIVGYAVSRAHHADVGGMSPGSMPAGARDVHQEGFRLPPVRLVAGGKRREAVQSIFLANVRNPAQRRADLEAQIGANERGMRRVGELLDEHGDRLLAAFDTVIEYSRQRVESEIATMPDGRFEATDVLEGDGVTDEEIPIHVAVEIDGSTMTVDFTGTAVQVAGNVNAPLSVAKSAVYYVIRCVTDPEIPPNQGCYEPITVRAPAGSVLNPTPPAAVVGGNVETSQRVADVVFAALGAAAPERVAAGGQGTMNNLVIGSSSFTYYETIGGGCGATASTNGLSGVQVGMTNTLNTPIEALETSYPLRVEEYSIREGSGGGGKTRGGDGLVREITVQTAATVSLLTERRETAPAGFAGGSNGKSGRNVIDGSPVGSKVIRDVEPGTTVRIETPGGGGYGPREESDSGGEEQ